MKNSLKITSLLFVMVIVFASCTLDDDNPGGGEPINYPVFANLFAASNTGNAVWVFDFKQPGISIRSLSGSSSDNAALYYDGEDDELTVASRDQKVLNTYRNVDNTSANGELSLLTSSDNVLESPRDLAVKDSIYIVSDDTDVDGDPTTADGSFYVFKKENDIYSLRNIVRVNFSVWGIELIGKDLYAVVDNTADVAVFKDFIETYKTNVTAVPDKQITIGGLTRGHGIAHDNGTVVITDIGDAQNDGDGGFNYISNFVSRFNAVNNGETLPLIGNQLRVDGNLTEMGNPVGVALDNQTQTIFIAERAKGGGKILFFENLGAGGNLKPTLISEFSGASSLYFLRR